jgi:hypothetical protein
METMHRVRSLLNRLYLAVAGLLLLGGCANVHFEGSKAELANQALIFGRIVLIRDGEVGVINASGTPIAIGALGANVEPKLVTEPFDEHGRFAWKLPPGRHLLSITLDQRSGDVFSLAFEVPEGGRAYYFGDLVLQGRKFFNALGAANVRDVSGRLDRNFDTERALLLQRYPQLAVPVENLKVFDASNDRSRLEVLGMELAAAPVCCTSLAELHFQKLPPDAPRVFEVSAIPGVYRFAQGRSPYLALELPRYQAPYTLTLRSHPVPTGIPGTFRVFVPAATLLDDKFNIVASIATDLVHPVPASLIPPRAASLAGEIRISADRAGAKYLVLHTTEQLLGRTRESSTFGMIPIPGGALPIGRKKPVGLEPSITGWIEVGVAAP